jgi:hypothetical protein
MKNRIKLLITAVLCLFSFIALCAGPKQSTDNKPQNPGISQMDTDTGNYSQADLSTTARYSDPAFNARFEKSDIQQVEFVNKQWQRVFDLQYYMSIIIFIVVIFIVLTGLYLSYKQFEFTHEMIRDHRDMKKAIVSQGPDGKSTITDTSAGEQAGTDISLSGTNTFEISKDGIKINSAVIGLIILSMSIAFFFLYLEFVYPIHQVKI